MAIRLLAAGHRVKIWNRTKSKTAAAAAAGAIVVDQARDAAADVDILFMILENGAAVMDVLFHTGVADALSAPTVLIDMSSAAPEMSRNVAAQLRAKGVDAIDAPVSGGPSGAEAGTLAIMAGATEAAFSRAGPLLSVLGRATHVGPPGSGQVAKLCNQLITATALGAISDMMLLAVAGGADPSKVREALMGGFADSKVLQIHGRRMIDRQFEPGGHVRTFLKDLDAAAHVAAEARLQLPALTFARNLMKEHAADGFAEADISSIIVAAEKRNPTIKLRKP